jgi:hypothetical protein
MPGEENIDVEKQEKEHAELTAQIETLTKSMAESTETYKAVAKVLGTFKFKEADFKEESID